MKILMIGDVVGRGGRSTVKNILPNLIKEHKIDFVTLQGENMASGFGLTLETVMEMLESGVDVITSGNHVWDKNDFIEHLDNPKIPVIRPMNYPMNTPGRGYLYESSPVGVVNLIGRVWVGEFDSPFSVADEVLSNLYLDKKPIIVDFHAEATSEKAALGWYLDGRVTAVVGTHTHVPTADCKILPSGTAFVSDLGMVGAENSILGAEIEGSLNRFLTSRKHRMKPETKGIMNFNSVLITTNDTNNRAISIERIDRKIEI